MFSTSRAAYLADMSRDQEEFNDWKRLATFSEEPGLTHRENFSNTGEGPFGMQESRIRERELNLRFVSEYFREE